MGCRRVQFCCLVVVALVLELLLDLAVSDLEVLPREEKRTRKMTMRMTMRMWTAMVKAQLLPATATGIIAPPTACLPPQVT